jgi:plasmid maintenance system antidote protein VapI
MADFLFSKYGLRDEKVFAEWYYMEKDYREIIEEEFLRRRGRNISYSITLFAKEIGLTRSLLQKVLSREKGISKDKAYQIGRSLGLGYRESKEFRYLVSAQSGRSKHERALAEQWLKRKSSAEEKAKS